MGCPMFFEARHETNHAGSRPPITCHTYNVDGTDPAHLEKRLSHLERALAIRGGRVTSVKRRTRSNGRAEAIVRYEVPTSESRSSTVGSQGSEEPRPSTLKQTR